MVVAHTQRKIRRVVGHLKSEATKSLREEGWFLDHSPWADHGWNVYLDSRAAMRRAIPHVENNPERKGKCRQRWSCVTPYDETTDRAARHGINI